MIEAHDLVKRYGSTMAVNDRSLSIRPGMVTVAAGPATTCYAWPRVTVSSAAG